MITNRKRQGVAAAGIGAATAATAILVAALAAGGANAAVPAPCPEGSGAAGVSCVIHNRDVLGTVGALTPGTCPDPGVLVRLQLLAGTDSTALRQARIDAHNAMVANKAAEVALNQAQTADTSSDVGHPDTAIVPPATTPTPVADAQDTAVTDAQAKALAASNAANTADARVDTLARSESRDVAAIAALQVQIGKYCTPTTTVVPTTTAPPTTVVTAPPVIVEQPSPVIVNGQAPAPQIVSGNLPVTG